MNTSPYLQRPLRSLKAYQREVASRPPPRRPASDERPQEASRPPPEPTAHEQG